MLTAAALLVMSSSSSYCDAAFGSSIHALSLAKRNVPLHYHHHRFHLSNYYHDNQEYLSSRNSNTSRSRRRRRSSSSSMLRMYVPHPPMTQTPALSSLHAASVVAAESSTAPSDTLPQFKTSHGLLSPRTVLRLEQNFAGNLDTSDELSYFLDTYKEFGPMACIPMLSDSRILPELTKAMRESIADGRKG